MKTTDLKLTVAYHDGGRLFAGDETEYQAGWYLFDGENDPTPVTVLEPFKNNPIEVESD